MDQFKETTLEGHIQLCELRYRSLEEKINALERRIIKVEDSLMSLKGELSQGFSSIALKIEKEHNKRAIQLIATAGSVIVAVLGALGVWLAHR